MLFSDAADHKSTASTTGPEWLAKAESVSMDAIRRALLLALTNAVEAFESRCENSIVMDVVAGSYCRIRRMIIVSMRIAEKG